MISIIAGNGDVVQKYDTSERRWVTTNNVPRGHDSILNVLRVTFLPVGFPHTVRPGKIYTLAYN